MWLFIKRNIKKIILFFLFFLLFLPFLTIANGENKRALELVYPTLPGVPTPKYVDSGLPEYVKYIFHLFISLLGFLILGVLVYNGIKYVASFGNVNTLKEAKDGILAGFLGGIILLLSYLIFNTVNPQLLILEPPKVEDIGASILPGVYICNYKLDNIKNLLLDYMSGENLDKQKKAVETLRNAFSKSTNENCFMVRNTGIINRPINGNNWTIFIVPEKSYDLEEGTWGWEFNYAVVLHENDKYGDRCAVFPSPNPDSGNFSLYRQVDNFYPTIDFDPKSVTLIKKNLPPANSLGVILYQGLGFNRLGSLEATTTPSSGQLQQVSGEAPITLEPNPSGSETASQLAKMTITPPDNPPDIHGTKVSLATSTIKFYSIEFFPANNYVAILKEDNKKCEVRKSADADITASPIGRCGSLCTVTHWVNDYMRQRFCQPCFNSIYVIKGTVL